MSAIRTAGHEPAGYTLLAYAATEVWIEGVRRAGTTDAEAVATAIRERPIVTALGEVSFDGNGDISTRSEPFTWYVWKDGRRVPAN